MSSESAQSKWHCFTLNQPLSGYCFHPLVINDSQFIIMSDDRVSWINSFYRFDTIRGDHTAAPMCPIKTAFHALSMSDVHRQKMLTLGFVRILFKKKAEMKRVLVLPDYFIEMMAKWVETECIYLLQRSGVSLWKMNLDAIITGI